MSKLLLLESGTQGLAIARDLKLYNHEVYMLTSSRHNYGDDSRAISKLYINKYSYTDSEYFNLLAGIISLHKIDAVIPMSDETSLFLSRNKEKLSPVVAYDLPDIDNFMKGYNKSKLMELCSAKGYPHPITQTNINKLEDVDKDVLKYPLLIKPNITCGARGMKLIYNHEELCQKLPDVIQEFGTCHLQQYIPPGGRQVEVQLYINQDKQLVASSVISKFRWYPEKGGSSCCAETIKNDKIVNILYHLLLDLNWVGFADFDTIEDPKTGALLIMELNPRVPACIKASIVSGVNWGQIIANEYLRLPRREYTYRPGKILKHLGFDTLWFLTSSNRFRTYPSFFKILGRNIYYQDWDGLNPIPFVRGSIKNIKKIFNPKFLKSKRV